MEQIKNSWFKVTLIILGILYLFSYGNRSNNNAIEIYKINTDCAERAKIYAEESSEKGPNYFDIWYVLQSNFNEENAACFAEFQHKGIEGKLTAEIIDVTHSRFIMERPTYTKETAATYVEYSREYDKKARELLHN